MSTTISLIALKVNDIKKNIGDYFSNSFSYQELMVIKSFVVDNYKIKLGHGLTATWGGKSIKARGILECIGGDHRFIAYFLTADSPVPGPTYVVPNKAGAIFLPFQEMAHFVDLVRNEGPIYAYLNSDKPEWNNLSTTPEPVGEGE